MKLKYIYLLIALLLSGTGIINAQTQQILSGTVTEITGKEKVPLIGVNVSIVNAQNRTLTGAVTNLDGQYNVPIPAGEKNLTVVFSYIGMKTTKIKYTGQKQYDVQMEAEGAILDQVTVYAQRVDRNSEGISQDELISATQKIDMEKLVMTTPVTSIEEVLQGQLGGVDIVMGSGDPGTRSTINIRGQGTLNASSDPLIVIDGVPYTEDVDANFEFSTANEEDLGAMLNLSPADIESVEVLKDASATAIWGTKGANGVLVIKTKQGKVGKTRFSFTSKLSTKNEAKTIPMLNGDEYTALMQEAIWNSARYVGLSNSAAYLRLLFDTPEIGYSPDWKYFNEYNQNTDWLSEIVQTGYTVENNFSMSGGGEKATYRLSTGLVNDEGTTIGTALQRFNASATINYQFSNKLRFGADFAYTESNQDSNWASTARGEAFGKMPNKSPYAIDAATGERLDDYFVYQGLLWEGAFSSNAEGSNASNYNPVAMVNEATKETNQRVTKMTLRVAEFKLLPELTYSAYASIGLTTTKVDKFLPQVVTAVAWTSQYANQGYKSYSEGLSISTENRLNFRKTWNEKHQLIANAIYRTSQSTGSRYESSSSGMASSSMADPTVSANVLRINSGESEGRSLGFTGLINYSFENRYVAHASISAESNSAMGRDKRMGYFPGVGLAWNIHNEPFLETIHRDWLDNMKFRFGIGQSGRAPKGNSIYLGAFAATDNYMTMPSIAPKRMQLDNLQWEVQTEYNYGLDMSFWKGRLRLTGDYYIKYTDELLRQNLSIPSSTGYASVLWYNSGRMKNYGWEARADVRIWEGQGWTISGNVNFSRNRNIIQEMPVNMREESGVAEGDADMKNGQYAFKNIVGNPSGSFYGYRSLGVYADKESTYARDKKGNVMNDINGNPIIMKNGIYNVAPGDAKYEDINHDGVINKYDMVYLGNSNPLVSGGGGLSVRYKQFSLNTLFHYRIGQSVVNMARMNNESMTGKRNQSTAVLRRWKNEGDITDIPRALYGQGLNYLGSDRFIEDGSFVRLKSVSLSYNFPKRILNRVGVNGLNVFVTGYNLFTWTNYTGQDPEVKVKSGLAQDGATTPVSRRFAFGLNLSF
ncbi:SusC/RagA family TonB-linked outer membrane protein [Bacteroidales bacterium OttesenSCG-928-L03]|nr:SusC/RagA family TonB-linked outer membrane protein [Bacteroidales bacterium OttesenSCG-928-L03]